jgi:ABC-2 type transport system permease protein
MSDAAKPAGPESSRLGSMTRGPATGTIHDIGYKRYVGPRRSAATRWRVIMRHQIAMGWKKWWRYKLALFFAVITMFITGGFIYFAGGRLLRGFGARSAELMVTLADSALPLSIRFFCMAAFVLTLTLGATIVASDNQSGAFTFYYVRSIRPRDYVIGKLAGFGTLVASIMLVPPLLLACFRLGMYDTLDEMLANLDILPKAIAVGGLATLAYTAVPLALSSFVGKPRYALALWAAYYVIVGNMAFGISHATTPGIAALDIPSALITVSFHLFDLHPLLRGFGKMSLDQAVIGLVVQSAVAVAILWFQVSRDQKTGVGGSS